MAILPATATKSLPMALTLVRSPPSASSICTMASMLSCNRDTCKGPFSGLGGGVEWSANTIEVQVHDDLLV